jgi:hypothetical protein
VAGVGSGGAGGIDSGAVDGELSSVDALLTGVDAELANVDKPPTTRTESSTMRRILRTVAAISLATGLAAGLVVTLASPAQADGATLSRAKTELTRRIDLRLGALQRFDGALTAAALRADAASMVNDYRVFLLVGPKVRLTIVGDHEAYAADRLQTVHNTLADLVAKAKTAGKDVTQAEQDLAEMQAAIRQGQGGHGWSGRHAARHPARSGRRRDSGGGRGGTPGARRDPARPAHRSGRGEGRPRLPPEPVSPFPPRRRSALPTSGPRHLPWAHFRIGPSSVRR